MLDTELIRDVARGNQAALGALYDRHAGLLLAVLTRILADVSEAEDVLHEVFLEVWEHAREHDPERGNVRAWLVMRARSRGLDRLRSLGRARRLPPAAAVCAAPDAGLAADVLGVRRAIAKLTPELRVLLELGYFQGMSSVEIARHQQLAVGTVKSRVARALAELRANLLDGAREIR